MNSIRIAFLVGGLFWLGGCSSPHQAPLNAIPRGKSIVFGSISIESPSNGPFAASVNVINTRNSKNVLEQRLKRLNEAFYWYLPPGQYAILDYEESNIISLVDVLTDNTTQHISSRRIYAEFTIDSEQTAVYVGTLAIASSSTSVTDDFDTAVTVFHSHFPALNTEPSKQLLHLEKQK